MNVRPAQQPMGFRGFRGSTGPGDPGDRGVAQLVAAWSADALLRVLLVLFAFLRCPQSMNVCQGSNV